MLKDVRTKHFSRSELSNIFDIGHGATFCSAFDTRHVACPPPGKLPKVVPKDVRMKCSSDSESMHSSWCHFYFIAKISWCQEMRFIPLYVINCSWCRVHIAPPYCGIGADTDTDIDTDTDTGDTSCPEYKLGAASASLASRWGSVMTILWSVNICVLSDSMHTIVKTHSKLIYKSHFYFKNHVFN